jgi:hypothetical protein
MDFGPALKKLHDVFRRRFNRRGRRDLYPQKGNSMNLDLRRMAAALRCLLLAAAALTVEAAAAAPADQEEWIALFNGRDLTGWTPKITGRALGDNFANTFRVEDGLLKVRYDQYKSFDRRFGHLFYKDPFSYYRLVVEYRFVGEQAPGGPGNWALRNSGVMLHSPHPKTMPRDQDFPISIEAQFLGGLSDGKPRSTMNLCTPGTHVVIDGKLHTDHCLSSSSKTFDGDQWVRAEMIVLGSGHITHLVNGEKVLEYSLPQFGGEAVSNFDASAKPDGQLMEGGYLSLQSESHPLDFRKVEVLNLAGCMDAKAVNYKRYYVKSEPKKCVYR